VDEIEDDEEEIFKIEAEVVGEDVVELETRGIEEVRVELIADDTFGEEAAAIDLVVGETVWVVSTVELAGFVVWARATAVGRAVGDVTSKTGSDENAVSPAERVTAPKAGSESVSGKSIPSDCQRVFEFVSTICRTVSTTTL